MVLKEKLNPMPHAVIEMLSLRDLSAAVLPMMLCSNLVSAAVPDLPSQAQLNYQSHTRAILASANACPPYIAQYHIRMTEGKGLEDYGLTMLQTSATVDFQFDGQTMYVAVKDSLQVGFRDDGTTTIPERPLAFQLIEYWSSRNGTADVVSESLGGDKQGRVPKIYNKGDSSGIPLMISSVIPISLKWNISDQISHLPEDFVSTSTQWTETAFDSLESSKGSYTKFTEIKLWEHDPMISGQLTSELRAQKRAWKSETVFGHNPLTILQTKGAFGSVLDESSWKPVNRKRYQYQVINNFPVPKSIEEWSGSQKHPILVATMVALRDSMTTGGLNGITIPDPPYKSKIIVDHRKSGTTNNSAKQLDTWPTDAVVISK